MTFHLQLGRTNRLSTSNLMVKINLDYYTSRISEIDKKPKQKKKGSNKISGKKYSIENGSSQ